MMVCSHRREETAELVLWSGLPVVCSLVSVVYIYCEMVIYGSHNVYPPYLATPALKLGSAWSQRVAVRRECNVTSLRKINKYPLQYL